MSDTEALINVVPADPPPDPDAPVAVQDFLECTPSPYPLPPSIPLTRAPPDTEYLPCDITRSLRLISALDSDYDRCVSDVETLSVSYGELKRSPASPGGNGVVREYSVSEQDLGPLRLRLEVSRKLNAALSARREATAEAVRLYENVRLKLQFPDTMVEVLMGVWV